MSNQNVIAANQGNGTDIKPQVELQAYPAGWNNLTAALLSETTQNPGKPLMADTDGLSITTTELLQATALAVYVLRQQIPAGEKYVGILLPPSVPGAVANIAVTAMGKIAVNLDVKNVADPIADCGIKYVISVADALAAQNITLPEGVTVVDARAIAAAKTDAAAIAFVRGLFTASEAEKPALLVSAFPGLLAKPDDVATIIFTTGSTGKPKGVMLTHGNIMFEALAIDQHYDLDNNVPDGGWFIGGFLPFYHALAYTGCIWTVVLRAKKIRVLYHKDPRNPRTVGSLCSTHKFNVIVTSPTLWSFYLRNKVEALASLELILLGSEKCPVPLWYATKAKLGKAPLEAFGASELSPLTTSNTRKTLRGFADLPVKGNRPGSVGQCVPGVAVKVTGVESPFPVITGRASVQDAQTLAEEAPEGAEAAVKEALAARKEQARQRVKPVIGLLWFKGPNVMKGYLNREDATREVLVDGWYCTGDLGFVDEDGFVYITGRLKRIAKIAGEMVPLGNIEEYIQGVTGLNLTNVFVGAVPDEKRGERPVVLVYVDDPAKRPDPKEVVAALLKAKVPTLFIPDSADFAFVDEPFPIAPGAGKLNLKALGELAQKLFAPPAAVPVQK